MSSVAGEVVMRGRMRLLACAVVLLAAGCAAAAPRDEERRRLGEVVGPFIEQRWVRSAAVGLIDPSGRRVYGFGRLSDDPRSPAPDGDTVYEIASVTKTFTALLLAEMAERGEVKLDDPVGGLLPADVRMPKADRPITLAALATHHGGLPRMPHNFHPADSGNPYADYTVERLYEFLAAARVHSTEEFEYSNAGYGLLGHALALRGGKSYESLVLERVCDPLKMSDTRVELGAGQRKRLAPPYDADFEPAENWDFRAIPAGGALRSTANDLLKYLDAQMGLSAGAGVPEALRRAIAQTHTAREAAGGDLKIALGWHVAPDGRLFHNGQTGGYHAFVAFDPKARAGVVVLTNTATMQADVIGGRAMRMLTGQMVPPVVLPAAIRLEPKTLERYAGRYALPGGGGGTLLVLRDGDRLITAAPGQSAVRIYPRTETEFFAKTTDSTGTFQFDAKGAVIGLLIKQDGKELLARRVP